MSDSSEGLSVNAAGIELGTHRCMQFTRHIDPLSKYLWVEANYRTSFCYRMPNLAQPLDAVCKKLPIGSEAFIHNPCISVATALGGRV